MWKIISPYITTNAAAILGFIVGKHSLRLPINMPIQVATAYSWYGEIFIILTNCFTMKLSVELNRGHMCSIMGMSHILIWDDNHNVIFECGADRINRISRMYSQKQIFEYLMIARKYWQDTGSQNFQEWDALQVIFGQHDCLLIDQLQLEKASL